MSEAYDMLLSQRHEAALERKIETLEAQVSAIKIAYSKLMNYRHNNALNFQLEKLDDYLDQLNDALEE